MVGVIAGSGRMPFHVAREARRQGRHVVAVGVRGWADAQLASAVDAYQELPVGQLGQLMTWLKSRGVGSVVMAGKVTKQVLFDQRGSFDAQLASLLSRAGDASVTTLLGAIAERLASEGITLVDSSTFLQPLLCPIGVLTTRQPTPADQGDLRLGLQIARALAAFDVGQTVVLKDRVVVAVEALEGTDETIRRAGAVAGPGTVVVKTGAPNQDRRFDLPVVGTDTVAILREAGVRCCALEAGATVLLDRTELLALANDAGLCLVGVSIEQPS